MSAEAMRNKLAELRRLRQESMQLQNRIQNQQSQLHHQVATQSVQRGSYDDRMHYDNYSIFLRQLHDPAFVSNMVIRDFNDSNQALIERRHKVERSKVLINNLMSEADMAYQDKIAHLDIDAIADHDAANVIVTPDNKNIKQITINQATTDKSTKRSKAKDKATQQKPPKPIRKVINLDNLPDNVADLEKYAVIDPELVGNYENTEEDTYSIKGNEDFNEVIDEYMLENIKAYINMCYAQILDVIKTYFIRASTKGYILPSRDEVDDIKSELEGYILIPYSKRFTIYRGCPIYYLSVVENEDDGTQEVKLVQAWVVRGMEYILLVTMNPKHYCKRWNCHKIVDHEKDIKFINYKYPIFRKITNRDIKRACFGRYKYTPCNPVSSPQIRQPLPETRNINDIVLSDIEGQYDESSTEDDTMSTVTDFDFSEDDGEYDGEYDVG